MQMAWLVLLLLPVLAQDSRSNLYFLGKITAISGEVATVRIDGKDLEAEVSSSKVPGSVAYRVGQQAIVYADGERTVIISPYRTPYLWGLLAIFCIATTILGRGKGVRGLIGTAVSMLVLVLWVLPQIAAGNNPLATTLLGMFSMLTLSIYFVHGINRKTSAAMLANTIATVVALLAALVVSQSMGFVGLNSEEAVDLYRNRRFYGAIDFLALYLAAVVVGALGALNDVTITQASVVQALAKTNPRYTVRELYQRGMTVGFDHMGSLVNTLVMAYAAGILPALVARDQNIPIWKLLNTEFWSTQIVSVLIGILVLVLSVPLTTFIAALWLRSKNHPPPPNPRSLEALLGEQGK
jgi:uncharacterized membrane protein